MQEEFPDWFGSQIHQRHVDNDQDPEVSTTSELFALANGPSWTPISVNSCVVDVALFRVKWFDTSNKGRKVNKLVLRNNMTQIDCSRCPSVEDDPDITHFDNSSDLPLSTSLNDLDNATLHIDGQSTVVDAPPDIIDVPDEDDDIIDDEDALGLMNLAIFLMHTKAQFGRQGSGQDDTRDKTRNLSLKEVAEAKGPVSIQFDVGDKQTLNPLGPHAAHWSNYIGEVIRTVPLYYPSWEKVPKERKVALISNNRTLFDLRPHIESPRWSDIYEGINMHLQKAYNTNKASFKAKHWRLDPQTGTYNVEAIRQTRPKEITADEGRPQTLRSTLCSLTPSSEHTLLTRYSLRMRTAAYMYEEMKRLEATGVYTEDEINRLAKRGKLRGHIPGVGRVLPSRATSRTSMPAPDKSLKSIHKKVDFMMSLVRSDSKYSNMFKEFELGGASGSGGCGDDEESGNDEKGEDEDEDGNGDD
ncbi:hypothetical protein Tco_0921089 [Tanacetum coccineum]